MWRNYLTVTLRALAKNRMYSFINIAGLALGLAASIVLLLYVRYETSYDAWLKDADRVYQVQSIYTDPETGYVTTQQGTHGAVAQPLAKDFPQIEAIARADDEQLVFLRRDGEPAFANVLLADEPFFRILEVPFLRGDPHTALDGADGLVMSRTEAVKQFGTIDVLGRPVTRISRGEKRELRVTGVFEDLPKNSHMSFRNVARISPQEAADCSWGCVNGYVYLKLRPGASPAEIERGLPAWEKRNIPPIDVGGAKVSEGDNFDWRLVNVRDVHLSGAEGSDEKPGSDVGTVTTFAVIALLILGIASANFVNLATARAGQRAREVALRKVLGANRGQLVVQFLGESLLLTGVGLLIAMALAELMLPRLSHFLNADLQLDYLGTNGVLGPVLLLWLVVGVAGGLYPALYLSRYQPGAVLKANRSSAEPAGTGRLRSLLVVAQFAVSIGLIVCTLVIYAQTRFVQTTDAGYRREGLLQVGNLNRSAMLPVTETLVREVKRLPGVRDAAVGGIYVASGTDLTINVQVPGRAKPMTIGWYSVSPEFFSTLGVKRLAGRTLSHAYAKDRIPYTFESGPAADAMYRQLATRGANVVVNRLAAKQLGFADPAQAIGKTFRVNQLPDEFGLLPVTIVGVVEDSRFRSLREPPEPMIFHDMGIYGALIVRYDSPDPEAVRTAVGNVWRRLAPDVPYEADYADAQLAELYQTDQARGISFAAFAGLAVVIACLGLFGLAAFTAERRTKEVGIRKVFGASVSDIVRLLAWQFSRPVMIANLVAWPIAWWIMRDWLNGFDLRIDLGPGPFVLAGLIAFVIAIGTVSGHALRVARTNPVHALRYE